MMLELNRNVTEKLKHIVKTSDIVILVERTDVLPLRFRGLVMCWHETSFLALALSYVDKVTWQRTTFTDQPCEPGLDARVQLALLGLWPGPGKMD